MAIAPDDRATRAFHLAVASDMPWEDLADSLAAQIREAPAAGSLGILYATDVLAEHLGKIVNRLRDGSGVAHWVGTVGIGVCATGREMFDRPAIVALVAPFAAERYRLIPSLGDGIGPLREALESWGRRPGVALVHADPRTPDLAELIRLVARDAVPFLVGGLTSSRGPHRQVAGAIDEGGLSGVMLADDVSIVSGLTQGCSPIGPIHEITAGEDNVVMEIDGRPALDVFKEEIGEVLARNLARVGGYIFVGLPVAGSDRPDYLVRNLVGIIPDRGWIAVAERIQAGDAILFCRRDRAAAGRDLERMLRDLKARAGGVPRAGIYVSCLARGPNLFGPDSAELKLIRDELGEFPLVGFFANGEISHDRLYGYTGVLSLFV